MASGVKWKGKEFLTKVEKAQAKKLNKAITLVYNEVRQSVSVPGRSITEVVSKSGKTRKKYGKKGEFVSQPGEPPRKQSGRLYRSVRKKVFAKGGRARVFDRGHLMEKGSKKMAARPHLKPALDKLRAAVAGILTGGIQSEVNL